MNWALNSVFTSYTLLYIRELSNNNMGIMSSSIYLPTLNGLITIHDYAYRPFNYLIFMSGKGHGKVQCSCGNYDHNKRR